jgi:hypothetical protein
LRAYAETRLRDAEKVTGEAVSGNGGRLCFMREDAGTVKK